jgi:multiple sugar transport system permease protein
MSRANPTGTLSASRRTRRRRLSMSRRESLEFYLFVSPWIIGFLLFMIGPIGASLYLGFTDYDAFTSPQWTGLVNFGKLFTDPLFWHSLRVSVVYALMSVPLNLTAGLIVALLMNQPLRGMSVFRTIYYMPSVISGVAASMLWLWVFNPNFGILNTLLSLIGIKGPAWLWDQSWALPSIVIMSLWGVGGSMLVYLGGLQGIPTSLYEAAEIDGASWWHRFWSITLPMLSPVIFYNLVTGIIGALQIFTQGYVMTGGGPNNATLFYVLYLYRNGFEWFRLGTASAMAWLLFMILIGLTLVVFRSSPLWVYYEGEES